MQVTIHQQDEDRPGIWKFTAKDDKQYLLVHTDKEGRTASFEIHVVKLGDNLVMDFFPTSLPEEEKLVIFTTAYPEFAVEGFELEAVDYLLEPFSLERFIKAVNRAANRLATSGAPEAEAPNFLMTKVDKKLFKVDFQDIIHFEAYGDYVKIFTKDKMLLTKERLSAVAQQLPPKQFFRIHRSYVIALSAIEFIEGNMVKIGKERLPISENLKEGLLEKLSRQRSYITLPH